MSHSANVIDFSNLSHFEGRGAKIKRPEHFTCFSLDENQKLKVASKESLRWYSPLPTPYELSGRFETFKHPEETDQHLDNLLATLKAREQQTGTRCTADLVTWRGLLTKLITLPYSHRDGPGDGFQFYATRFQGSVFMEENFEMRERRRAAEARNDHGRNPDHTNEIFSYMGYRFETLNTAKTPPTQYSHQEQQRLMQERMMSDTDTSAQYCSVVRTGVRSVSLVIAGEVDAVVESATGSDVPDMVELKTNNVPHRPDQKEKFEKKLVKVWAQSFLLGVPLIVVGFRDRFQRLVTVNQYRTVDIPKRAGLPGTEYSWSRDVCINFLAAALDTIESCVKEEGRRYKVVYETGRPFVRIEETNDSGIGTTVSTEFFQWRTSPDGLALRPAED